jgi:hypothetical protein
MFEEQIDASMAADGSIGPSLEAVEKIDGLMKDADIQELEDSIVRNMRNRDFIYIIDYEYLLKRQKEI